MDVAVDAMFRSHVLDSLSVSRLCPDFVVVDVARLMDAARPSVGTLLSVPWDQPAATFFIRARCFFWECIQSMLLK